MLRFVGLAASLGGCYSPAYVDCAITCPDGETCPDGFQCEPSLKVCRPQGASGSCPAPGGDAADRDAVSGDGSNQQLGDYCASLNNSYIYCQDFDVGTLQEQGWTVAELFGGIATLVGPGNTGSAPMQFEATTPSSGDPAEAQVRGTFLIPANSTSNRLSIYFDMQQTARMPGTQKVVFAVRVPGFVAVNLSSDGPSTLSATINNVNTAVSYSFSTEWVRYELRFDVPPGGGSGDAGTGMLSAGFFVNGNSVSSVAFMPKPPLSMPWEMYFGLAGSANNTAIRFSYDNVVVDH